MKKLKHVFVVCLLEVSFTHLLHKNMSAFSKESNRKIIMANGIIFLLVGKFTAIYIIHVIVCFPQGRSSCKERRFPITKLSRKYLK